MTDDFPIEGEDGGYVPCDELAAALNADEEGAIYGLATGYVAQDQSPSALPAQEREAIVGSAVGFVPGPCEECVDGRQKYVVDTFDRIVSPGWGTATGPDYDITTPADTWVKDPVIEVLGPTTEAVNGDFGSSNHQGGATTSTVTDMLLGIPSTWVAGAAWIEGRWLVRATRYTQVWYLYDIPNLRAIFFEISSLGLAPSLIHGRYQSGVNVFQFNDDNGVNIVDDPFWVALRLEAGTVSVKHWPFADPEPASWDPFTVSGVALQIADISHAVYRNGQAAVGAPAGSGSTGYIELTVPC